MRKIKLYALCLMATVTMFGCSKYDDTELKNNVSDLKSRVEKLETWCKTANGQISALQGIVTALEAKDFVTGVTPIMEGSKEVGYTITFAKGKPITIMHGKDGKDGITPVIGVKQDADDSHYYWTIKIGNTDATWLTDENDNRIRTTGDKGADGGSPVLSVADFEGHLYWKVDGEWLLSGGNKVPATGDKGATGSTGSAGAQGDAIFAADGIDYTTDPENVIFTLADGTTKITLPKSSMITVGFDKYDLFYGSTSNNEITLILPSTLKETDYTAIVATITNESGSGMDIQTRSAATESIWGVIVTKPVFTNGTLVAGSAKISMTPPANITLSQTAMLKVTITDKNGMEFSITRPVKFFDGEIIESTAGNLSNKVTNMQVTKLAVKGSVNADDFTFIKALSALEVLDLSMTDMTSIDNGALQFSLPNTILKQVIIPASVTAIGDNAFRNCQALETFDLVNTENLGIRSFQDCIKLRSIALGNKLTAINQSTFFNCKSLVSLDIPSSVNTLGRWLFENCENLETITLHEGLQSLSQSTFYGCGVMSIRIPSTVTEIPNWAFQNCKKLERITLHDDITLIGEAAFLSCYSLKGIKIPTSVTVINAVTFRECVNLQTVTLHNGITEIQEAAFELCKSLRSENVINSTFVLPTSLNILGVNAFNSCNSLQYVDMGQTSVKDIPTNLFTGCQKLKSVVLPTNLETIGEWAFGGSTLNVIDIPASVTSIADYAFWDCTSLKGVYCRGTDAPQIFTNTFDKLAKTGRILYVPKGYKVSYTLLSDYFENTIEIL